MGENAQRTIDSLSLSILIAFTSSFYSANQMISRCTGNTSPSLMLSFSRSSVRSFLFIRIHLIRTSCFLIRLSYFLIFTINSVSNGVFYIIHLTRSDPLSNWGCIVRLHSIGRKWIWNSLKINRNRPAFIALCPARQSAFSALSFSQSVCN